jgi:hypothetical protein
MTASERAMQINVNNTTFSLVTEPEYWANYGVHTAADLDAYLAFEMYIEVYKDVNGIKPKWLRWWERTATEWQHATDLI